MRYHAKNGYHPGNGQVPMNSCEVGVRVWGQDLKITLGRDKSFSKSSSPWMRPPEPPVDSSKEVKLKKCSSMERGRNQSSLDRGVAESRSRVVCIFPIIIL